MKSKVFMQPRPEANVRVNEHFAGIQKVNSDVPDVSDKDKKGGKLSKAMAALLPKLIENYALVLNFLVRNFTIDTLVTNKLVYDENERQISIYEREIKRLKDQNTCIGVQMAIDYGLIYKAFQTAADDDASLKILRDEFGKPFERTPLTEEQKAAIAKKKADTAAKKAAKTANNA